MTKQSKFCKYVRVLGRAMKKYCLLIILISLVVIAFFVSECQYSSKTSDIVLLITALIILWYTFETSLIRKKEESVLSRKKQPIVGFTLNLNPSNIRDIQFHISNLSDYPVACLVKMNVKIGENLIPMIWPEYDGKKCWNIQYKESKQGHFDWIEFLKIPGILSTEHIRLLDNIPKLPAQYLANQFLKYNESIKVHLNIQIDLDVFSVNEFKYHSHYPVTRYEFDLSRCALIGTLCSDRPYFDYDTVPDWVIKGKCLDQYL